jgi:hypothetical protein
MEINYQERARNRSTSRHGPLTATVRHTIRKVSKPYITTGTAGGCRNPLVEITPEE